MDEISFDAGDTGPGEVGSVTIGDYVYTLYTDHTAYARVNDSSKTSYGPLQESITYEGTTYVLTSLHKHNIWFEDEGCFQYCSEMEAAPEIPSAVTDMSCCFQQCYSLTNAPAIPPGVTNMMHCFAHCDSLTTAPSIPSSVMDMWGCFSGCTALTTVPSIPSGVTEMGYCFAGCTSLTGTIAVHGAPTYYDNCFYNTTQPITLAVSDESEIPTWREVALTSPAGNVTVIYADYNPEPTAIVTVTRVAAKGDTTEYAYGQWAYVQVATIASTEQAPDNVADTPTITLDGATVTPQQAGGTANYVGWLSLGDEAAHTIGATPHDTYKTGQEVTVTLVPAYSPMEFHSSGVGASFGKHAEAGKLTSAWPIESDGDVKATAAGVTHSLVGKQDALTAGSGIDITGGTISVIFDAIYPKGSIYMSTEKDTDGGPKIAALMPGTTWERITGRFLLAATDNGGTGGNSTASVQAGYTGGEAAHQLTVSEMPSHNHTVNMGLHDNRYTTSGHRTEWGNNSNTTGHPTTTDTGGNGAHNTMPPYLAVYIWKRTA